MSDIIEVTFTGPITAANLTEATTQAISRQKQTDATRFLVDANGWDVGASFFDIYEMADTQYSKEELSRQSRIAIILPTSVNVQEAGRFYETVCFNRGWNARVCSDRQSAKDWLLGKTSTPD